MIMQVLKNSLESLHNVYPASQSKITCWYGTGPTSKMDSEHSQTLKLCVKITTESHYFRKLAILDV